MKPKTSETSVTVRAVAEFLQGLEQATATATETDMAVLKALGDVLLFAGDSDHPLYFVWP